jgi:hypothetical protein
VRITWSLAFLFLYSKSMRFPLPGCDKYYIDIK